MEDRTTERRLQLLEERMAKAEWRDERFEERLNMGASTFGELKFAVAELQPKPIRAWKIAGAVFSAALVAAGLVWQAARYPDRGEFNDERHRTAGEIRALEKTTQDLKESQIGQANDIKVTRDTTNRIEQQQNKIEDKIDRMMRRQRVSR